jgi:hypothetical protein
MKNLWTENENTSEKWISEYIEPTATKSIYQCLLVHCRNKSYHDWKIYWRKLVEEYTTCDLTHFNDKWPAIAGLAANIERHSKEVLLRGLWKNYLLEELLWYTTRPGTRPRDRPAARPGRRRAKTRKRTCGISKTQVEKYVPSWSWISMNATIMWRGPFLIADTDINWIACVQSATNTEIIVDAPLIRMSKLCPCCGPQHYEIQCYGKPNVSKMRWDPDEDPTDPSKLWALQIVRSSGGERTTFRGIVVKEEPKSKSSWSRVGHIDVYWSQRDFGAAAPPLWLGEKQRIKLI